MSHQYNNCINPVRVDTTHMEREQRKAYKRMEHGAGKGDLPRNIWSDSFKMNYDDIDWSSNQSPNHHLRRRLSKGLAGRKMTVFYYD